MYPATITRQRAYQIEQVSRRESWYLETGADPDQWRSMSARQRAVYVRWRNWYRKRRALRELLRGDGSGIASDENGTFSPPKWDKPSRFPFPSVSSPPLNQPASHRVGEVNRKPRGNLPLNRGIGAQGGYGGIPLICPHCGETIMGPEASEGWKPGEASRVVKALMGVMGAKRK